MKVPASNIHLARQDAAQRLQRAGEAGDAAAVIGALDELLGGAIARSGAAEEAERLVDVALEIRDRSSTKAALRRVQPVLTEIGKLMGEKATRLLGGSKVEVEGPDGITTDQLMSAVYCSEAITAMRMAAEKVHGMAEANMTAGELYEDLELEDQPLPGDVPSVN